MSRILLCLWLIACGYFPMSFIEDMLQLGNNSRLVSGVQEAASLATIKTLLRKEAPGLSEPVITKVATAIQCAKMRQVETNGILSIIDYSLPSSEKRLWVLDLKENKLLFHTYVAHGIKSGTLLSNYFSNKNNSRASSLGVYKTEKAYYGREGLSLRLDGLEPSFNDNAANRSVVMHGGWYVEENFIKKYGRPGRSWGCPALPLTLYQAIINTIKDNSLFVVYYPSDQWLSKSRFLHCESNLSQPTVSSVPSVIKTAEEETREPVLLTSLSGKGRGTEEGSAIVAMTAANYEQTFHNKPPLGRMLRRQIDTVEYIALSAREFANLVRSVEQNPQALEALSKVYFVAPFLKVIRGYYETQMKVLPLGKIKQVVPNRYNDEEHYTVHFETQRTLSLHVESQFIRWLGL